MYNKIDFLFNGEELRSCLPPCHQHLPSAISSTRETRTCMMSSGIVVNIRIAFDNEQHGHEWYLYIFSLIIELPSTTRNEEMCDVFATLINIRIRIHALEKPAVKSSWEMSKRVSKCPITDPPIYAPLGTLTWGIYWRPPLGRTLGNSTLWNCLVSVSWTG